MDYKKFYDEFFNNYFQYKEISFSDIINVNNNEIIYKFNDEIKIVSLEEAYNNCVNSLSIDGELKSKIVGGRYFGSSIGFYTIHEKDYVLIIKYEMNYTKFRKFLNKLGWYWQTKYYSEFRTFQKKLNDNGYSTFDLT